MREIINIQIGECGNKIGSKFWEIISKEHGIDEAGIVNDNSCLKSEKINVYYNECINSIYLPRAILIDLDREIIDLIRTNPFSQLFKAENFVFGTQSTEHKWYEGYYLAGQELIDIDLDSIRKEAESCDCFFKCVIVLEVVLDQEWDRYWYLD